ncbi:aryldialkylphosphatase [Planobispora siamensis]|uniref:Aryldialkylphosphatase n=1 Tax=Planobispora siamensis TaxID=936338 RepID=A0A8J3SRN5_9ACTN|nr:aryldialkylphosphatase [Planobispora siamensis]GIH94438.1 aryldialkylphosphatase [Planobispora siamensis]
MPELPVIRTLTGALSPAEITGAVLPGEHLRTDTRWGVGVDSDPHRWLDEEQSVIAELQGLRRSDDLGLVVDAACVGAGRDVSALARITSASRVAVVAATGFFAGPFLPSWTAEADVDELTRHLMGEIGQGLDGTSAKPGLIGQIGAWSGEPTPVEERCAAAAARASLASGLPVAVHRRGGLALMELLLAEGLPAHRVSVGDAGTDSAVPHKIAEAGGYVRLTSVGADRLRDALDLIAAGHAHRLLLGSGLSRVAEIERYGGPGYGHLFRTFLPRLREAGVPEETIRLITHDNPLRWMTGME